MTFVGEPPGPFAPVGPVGPAGPVAPPVAPPLLELACGYASRAYRPRPMTKLTQFTSCTLSCTPFAAIPTFATADASWMTKLKVTGTPMGNTIGPTSVDVLQSTMRANGALLLEVPAADGLAFGPL